MYYTFRVIVPHLCYTVLLNCPACLMNSARGQKIYGVGEFRTLANDAATTNGKYQRCNIPHASSYYFVRLKDASVTQNSCNILQIPRNDYSASQCVQRDTFARV